MEDETKTLIYYALFIGLTAFVIISVLFNPFNMHEFNVEANFVSKDYTGSVYNITISKSWSSQNPKYAEIYISYAAHNYKYEMDFESEPVWFTYITLSNKTSVEVQILHHFSNINGQYGWQTDRHAFDLVSK